MKCEKCSCRYPDEIMPWGLCPACWEKFESETAKTEKRQPTSDLSTKEILELSTADDLSQEEFFEILESHNVHPGDIEELLGNETTRSYEQWMYANIK